MHQSFISYKNYRYLKLSIGLCVAVFALYLFADPLTQPRGGTWLGYAGGTLSALIVVWLACLGIRKRKYRDTEVQAVGWVSIHVYLGTSLLLIATLHSGFEIGFNIHTLAYLLTTLVVFSGFYGLFAYAVYPTKITVNRDGVNRDNMFSEMAEIDEKCLALSESISSDIFSKILASVENTQIKSNLFTRLFQDANIPDGALKDAIEFTNAQIEELKNTGESKEELGEINNLLKEKAALIRRIELDIRYHFRLDWWLYLHVPLTVGLLVSILLHVFVVLYYW